ncbi:hypothetical protein C823_003911 [Eubacterium plexicaudatum ASF492]|nr:hypothetical protein C823_003911 [Eubacterium plexicaudatum ASF492]
MNFKKKSRLCMVISITCIFVMCFGATAAGAYTKSDSKTGERPLQQSKPVKSNKMVDVKSKRNHDTLEMKTLKLATKYIIGWKMKPNYALSVKENIVLIKIIYRLPIFICQRMNGFQ